jgi:hypothetical protein
VANPRRLSDEAKELRFRSERLLWVKADATSGDLFRFLGQRFKGEPSSLDLLPMDLRERDLV